MSVTNLYSRGFIVAAIYRFDIFRVEDILIRGRDSVYIFQYQTFSRSGMKIANTYNHYSGNSLLFFRLRP